MQLLEHVTMATTPTGDSQDQDIVHVITGVWDPRETSFAVLNKETPHDLNSVYLTIGKKKVEAVQIWRTTGIEFRPTFNVYFLL